MAQRSSRGGRWGRTRSPVLTSSWSVSTLCYFLQRSTQAARNPLGDRTDWVRVEYGVRTGPSFKERSSCLTHFSSACLVSTARQDPDRACDRSASRMFPYASCTALMGTCLNASSALIQLLLLGSFSHCGYLMLTPHRRRPALWVSGKRYSQGETRHLIGCLTHSLHSH